MEENIIINNKTQLALACIMFFSPLIKRDINNGIINISDKEYINKYIKYGNLNIIILLFIIIFGTISFFTQNTIINIIYQIFLRALTVSLLGGIYLTIKNLLSNKFN